VTPERKTILIVEDDASLRAALAAGFRRTPYDVVTATLAEALERFAAGLRPHLVIADLWGGPPACERLADGLRRWGPAARVLCLSSRSCPRLGEAACLSEFALEGTVPRREQLLEFVSRILA